jgi:ligand-binding sensor domain-containing protein
MVLAVLASSASLLGLDPKTPLNQYGHDTWDGDSGLPQNTVTAIVQTRDGYVWFGTQEGLVRFDGVSFSIFDTRNTKAMSDDWVQSLCETREGILWIGTVTGLIRYKDGVFSAFAKRVSTAP